MTERLAQWLNACGDRIVIADDSGAAVTIQQAIQLGRDVVKASPGVDRKLVFLLVGNTVKSVSAYLALIASGDPVLLLDNEIAQSTLDALVTTYRPNRVVAPDRTEPLVLAHDDPIDLHRDLAILLATSGSTGSPKLARFTWPQLMANATAIVNYLGVTPQDRPILILPFHYSFGMSVLHSHLTCGARIELTRYSLMQREFWDRVRSSCATSFSGVPFHYEALRRLGFQRIDAPSIKTWTQAGGRLSAEHARYFAAETKARGARFFVMYGQTEAGPRISYIPPEDVHDHAGGIGIPIPGVTIELIDDAGALITAPNTDGELVCISPSVMMGYALTRADLGRGDDMRGRLFTGDIARRDGAGRYTITGRKSRFVKLMGTRVSLDDLEKFAASLGYTTAVAGEDDLVVIGIEGGTPADVEALKQAAVAAFRFSPRALRVKALDALPRNASGKLRYAELLTLGKAPG